MIVDVLHDPENLRAALTALLRQVGGKAAIPGRDAEDESVRVSAEEWQQLQAELGDATEVPGEGWKI